MRNTPFDHSLFYENKLYWIMLKKIVIVVVDDDDDELFCGIQKQPLRGVPRKRCSENMQQIYRRTPMPKSDFNKVALQLY